MNREPLVTIATITAAVVAVIALLVAYGVDITEAQQNGILGVVAVVAPFVVAFLTRPKVTPVDDPVSSDGYRLQKSDFKAK